MFIEINEIHVHELDGYGARDNPELAAAYSRGDKWRVVIYHRGGVKTEFKSTPVEASLFVAKWLGENPGIEGSGVLWE